MLLLKTEAKQQQAYWEWSFIRYTVPLNRRDTTTSTPNFICHQTLYRPSKQKGHNSQHTEFYTQANTDFAPLSVCKRTDRQANCTWCTC